jgi:cobalt-zinc-cadmium efflux system membrane fusion protein
VGGILEEGLLPLRFLFNIPASAVLQEEDNNYVLVSIGNNKYIKRKVTTVSATGERLVILSGLNAGEHVVTKGAFYLNDAR